MNDEDQPITHRKRTLAVDCDSVLHEYTTPWIAHDVLPDPPVPGAIEWLNGIVKELTVVIHTTRGSTPEGSAAVLAWLRTWGYTGPDLLVTAHKIPALMYLDDRARRFDGSNFPTAHEVHAARPWNKPKTPGPPPVDD